MSAMLKILSKTLAFTDRIINTSLLFVNFFLKAPNRNEFHRSTQKFFKKKQASKELNLFVFVPPTVYKNFPMLMINFYSKMALDIKIGIFT